MNKRDLLLAGAGLLLTAGGWITTSRAKDRAGSHALDGTNLDWSHSDGQLHVRFDAPTKGWIAVGFNENRRLKGTHFVIAAADGRIVRIEEHVALVPDHKAVRDLGIPPALGNASVSLKENRSYLAFSLPHALPHRPELPLTPGSRVHMMLAWSHSPDFDHHSAWRRHVDIVL